MSHLKPWARQRGLSHDMAQRTPTASQEVAAKQVRVFLAFSEYLRGPPSPPHAPRVDNSQCRLFKYVGCRALLFTCGRRCTQTSCLCLCWLSTFPDFMSGIVSLLLEDAAGQR